MTASERRESITVDQFVAAPRERVWRYLTEPDLHAHWWVPGDVAADEGHEFHLQMPGWGAVPCRVIESKPYERFVYTFNGDWTLHWHLVPEGAGTRLLLEHSGFDLDDPQARAAFERMSGGWRSLILPALARTAAEPNAIPRE